VKRAQQITNYKLKNKEKNIKNDNFTDDYHRAFAFIREYRARPSVYLSVCHTLVLGQNG